MDSDMQEQYLQKLQEFVYDEDKIVTYSWLSSKLELDANSCKTLLKVFENDQRGVKMCELGIVYMLAGILEENNNISIILVNQDEIESKKKLFKTVSSEFIYSIQKSKKIDLNSIGMVDMFDIHAPCEKPMIGSIISKNCIKRILKEKKVIPLAPRAASTDKSKGSHMFGKEKTPIKVEVKTEPKVNGSTDKTDSKPVTTAKINKAKPAASKGAGIASFFSKAPIKSEKKPTENIKEEESPKIEKMEVDDDGSDTEVEEIEVSISTKDSEKIDKKENTRTKKSTLYDSGTDEEALKIEEANKKNATQSSKQQTKKKPAKRARKKDTSEERPQKRRKRIVTRNDSDSDDMFNDEEIETEEIVENSEDDQPVFRKTKAPLAPLNKKRKLVDKTYTDEEGYIITKKEWIVESGSEVEEETKEQKNPQVEPKEKSVSKENPAPKEKKKNPSPKDKSVTNEISPNKPVKGKKGSKQPAANQPTLMNFFKKK